MLIDFTFISLFFSKAKKRNSRFFSLLPLFSEREKRSKNSKLFYLVFIYCHFVSHLPCILPVLSALFYSLKLCFLCTSELHSIQIAFIAHTWYCGIATF